jgi:phosphoglycerate dehydrogenase-like enzyme
MSIGARGARAGAAALAVAFGGCSRDVARPAQTHLARPVAGAERPAVVVADSPEGRPRILVEVYDLPRAFPPSHARMVADSVPEAEFIMAPADSLAARVADVDALIGTPSPAVLERAGPRLKWIQVHDGGVDRYANLFSRLGERGITLTDSKILKGPEMADHALALLLGLTRQINRTMAQQAREQWNQRGLAPIELRGRTALVVGLGGAGTQIAERAFAFGMRVIATDPKNIPYMRAVERVEKPDMLLQLLPEADVVFMAAPFTPETKGLFGPKEFAAMKRGVYFINISRGGAVDTDALLSALEAGQVAGAGLDVVSPEPLPKGHPLWGMDNVIITPHLAGNSDHGITRRTALFIENARRFVRGQPLRNIVDLKLGY